MEQGYISVYRKIKENPIYRKGEYFRIWLHILLSVNHKQKSFIWNNKKMTLNPGQGILSIRGISEELKIPNSTVRRAFEYLETESQIKTERTTKYTLVTVLNWQSYQKKKKKNESQMNHKRITNESQADLNNNDNNDNNEINISVGEAAEKLIKDYNEFHHRNFKSAQSITSNLEYWLKVYSLKEIMEAHRKIPQHHFWKKSMDIVTFLRRRNPNQENVDYIGQLLNYKGEGNSNKPLSDTNDTRGADYYK